MSEQMWFCPNCGQWGRDQFGAHRLPERDVWDKERCETVPVLVTIGPFLRRVSERERSATTDPTETG